jgi:hypothetical protein
LIKILVSVLMGDRPAGNNKTPVLALGSAFSQRKNREQGAKQERSFHFEFGDGFK